MLHEGVPGHLRQTLMDWIAQFFPDTKRMTDSTLERLMKRLLLFERRLKIQLAGNSASTKRASLFQLIGENDELCLNVIDMLLGDHSYADQSADALGKFLEEASSAWRVSRYSSAWQLTRRVDDTMTSVAHAAMAPDDRAARHLREAWKAAFGRTPDAGTAFREAVCAIEAILAPVVSPTNEKATLGTMLSSIRDKPGAFVLRLDTEEPSALAAFAACLRNIWENDPRHGTGKLKSPTERHAQDAVILAAEVVQLVRQGGFLRA
jgi:hypothetical protein